MEKSEQINELAASLSMAQSELENASKDSDNPYFKSKYADLAQVINTLKPVFGRHGLSYSQHPSYVDGSVNLTTIVMHKSGQWMSSCMSAPVVKKDPQGVGSAVTYCRRYALAAIAGIAQEDDDGNEASNRQAKEERPAIRNNRIQENYAITKNGFEALKEGIKSNDNRSQKEKLDDILGGDFIPDFNAISNPCPKKAVQEKDRPADKPVLPPVTNSPDFIPDMFCDTFPELAEFNGKRICELTKEQTDRAFKGLAGLTSKVKTKEAKDWIKNLTEEISKHSFMVNS